MALIKIAAVYYNGHINHTDSPCG